MEETIDEIEFSGKPSSFKEITMAHLSRIAQLSSKELRGGYYTTAPTKSGEEKEVYIEDTREALSNAIYCLALMLYSKFDKDTKKVFEDFQNTLAERKKKFLDATSIKEQEVLGEAYYEGNDKVLLEEYKIAKMGMYWDLLQQLYLLLARLNYFEIGGGIF